MRKYFTKRCIGLHLIALVGVPGCLYAGWWQYHVALGGNGLSWAYTVEWPFFALYGAYVWWRLIHDERTPLDKLWAAKQRAAVEASGRPLYQIPGWATDKSCPREVVATSMEAAQELALAPVNAEQSALRTAAALEENAASLSAGAAAPQPVDDGRAHPAPTLGPRHLDAEPQEAAATGLTTYPGEVIDAEVVNVQVHRDEELDAYNRYLTELSWETTAPKTWASARRRGRRVGRAPVAGGAVPGTAAPELPAAPVAGDVGSDPAGASDRGQLHSPGV